MLYLFDFENGLFYSCSACETANRASSSFAVVAVRDPPSRVFDDECEGWDPESDLRGLEAGTCLVAPRLSSRVRWWVDFFAADDGRERTGPGFRFNAGSPWVSVRRDLF